MTQEHSESQPEMKDAVRILEAILFASAEPVNTKTLHDRMPENSDVGGMLMALQAEYKTRGVNLIEMDGTWAFRTASDLGEALQVTKDVKRKLSRSAMETLAIIAYHQPVTRAEIENIRGVATHKGMLDILMEVNWIKPGRRRETPGRPVTWITTTNFLDQFGLESLMDLPGLDELKASGLLDRRPAIDALPTTGDLFSEEDVASFDDKEYGAEETEVELRAAAEDDDADEEAIEAGVEPEDESDDEDFDDEDEDESDEDDEDFDDEDEDEEDEE